MNSNNSKRYEQEKQTKETKQLFCGINNCPQIFSEFTSLLQHIDSDHKNFNIKGVDIYFLIVVHLINIFVI